MRKKATEADIFYIQGHTDMEPVELSRKLGLSQKAVEGILASYKPKPKTFFDHPAPGVTLYTPAQSSHDDKLEKGDGKFQERFKKNLHIIDPTEPVF